MYRTHHEALSRAAEAVQMRQSLRAQHEAVAARLDVESGRRRKLIARLRAERKDVARLEGISFQRLFAMVGGELEDKLAKEQAEAAAVELRFVEQNLLVAALRAELEGLDRRIAELGDVDALYHEALEAKGRMLVERNDEHGRMVLALAEEHSEACAKHREIREAIVCGDELARVLAEAARAIDLAAAEESAILAHSAFVASMRKTRLLDEASSHINSAQAVFERFRKELSEIEGMALHDDDDDAERKGWLDGLIDRLIEGTTERLVANVATLRGHVSLRLAQLAELEAENFERRRERRKRLEELIHVG